MNEGTKSNLIVLLVWTGIATVIIGIFAYMIVSDKSTEELVAECESKGPGYELKVSGLDEDGYGTDVERKCEYNSKKLYYDCILKLQASNDDKYSRTHTCDDSGNVKLLGEEYLAPGDKACNIKGNISYNSGEKIYHVPGQKYYDATSIDTAYGEKIFCSEQEAINAGWRKSYE